MIYNLYCTFRWISACNSKEVWPKLGSRSQKSSLPQTISRIFFSHIAKNRILLGEHPSRGITQTQYQRNTGTIRKMSSPEKTTPGDFWLGIEVSYIIFFKDFWLTSFCYSSKSYILSSFIMISFDKPHQKKGNFSFQNES